MASGGSSAEMVSSNVGGRRSAVVIGVSSMHGMSKDEKKIRHRRLVQSSCSGVIYTQEDSILCGHI